MRLSKLSSEPIYSYVRSLKGIIGYRTSPGAPAVGSAMGAHADTYFLAHGYQLGTVRLIQKAYEEADGMDTFVEHASGACYSKQSPNIYW
jgi:hypothetical protein